MGIFEHLAIIIFRNATGDSSKRWLLTPFVLLMFISAIALFFIAALMTDRWLNLTGVSLPVWTIFLAIFLIVPGTSLAFWTWIEFIKARGTPVPINPPQRLIVSGPYAYTRNPMLTGLYLIFFGIGILIGSLSFTLFYTPLFILVNTLYIKKVEEHEMELKFGQAYREYKKRVPLYFPRIGRFN